MDLIKKYKEVRKKEEEHNKLEELKRYKKELNDLNNLVKKALKNNSTFICYEYSWVSWDTVYKLGFKDVLPGSSCRLNEKSLRKLQKELKKYKLN